MLLALLSVCLSFRFPDNALIYKPAAGVEEKLRKTYGERLCPTDWNSIPDAFKNSFETALTTKVTEYLNDCRTTGTPWDSLSNLDDPNNVLELIRRIRLMLCAKYAGLTLTGVTTDLDTCLSYAVSFLQMIYKPIRLYDTDPMIWGLQVPEETAGIIALSGTDEMMVSCNKNSAMAAFTLPPNNDEFTRCLHDSNAWYNTETCPQSAPISEAEVTYNYLVHASYIGLTSLIIKATQLSEYYRLWAPTADDLKSSGNVDGFRGDGSFIHHASIPGSGDEGLEFVHHTLTILAGLDPNVPDQKKLATTVLDVLLVYFNKTIAPALVQCTFSGALLGIGVANETINGTMRNALALSFFASTYRALERFGYMSGEQAALIRTIGGYMQEQAVKCLPDAVASFPQAFSKSLQDAYQVYGLTSGSGTFTPTMWTGVEWLPYADAVIIGTERFRYIMAMTSCRTSNYACSNGINKKGFYQRYGHEYVYPVGVPHMYDNYYPTAVFNGYQGTIISSSDPTDPQRKCPGLSNLPNDLSKSCLAGLFSVGDLSFIVFSLFDPRTTLKALKIVIFEKVGSSSETLEAFHTAVVAQVSGGNTPIRYNLLNIPTKGNSIFATSNKGRIVAAPKMINDAKHIFAQLPNGSSHYKTGVCIYGEGVSVAACTGSQSGSYAAMADGGSATLKFKKYLRAVNTIIDNGMTSGQFLYTYYPLLSNSETDATFQQRCTQQTLTVQLLSDGLDDVGAVMFSKTSADGVQYNLTVAQAAGDITFPSGYHMHLSGPASILNMMKDNNNTFYISDVSLQAREVVVTFTSLSDSLLMEHNCTSVELNDDSVTAVVPVWRGSGCFLVFNHQARVLYLKKQKLVRQDLPIIIAIALLVAAILLAVSLTIYCLTKKRVASAAKRARINPTCVRNPGEARLMNNSRSVSSIDVRPPSIRVERRFAQDSFDEDQIANLAELMYIRGQ